MDIKFSKAAIFLASAAYCADIDVYTAFKLGMQSGPKYLPAESQRAIADGVNNGHISGPMGTVLPEFFDLSLNASIKIIDNFSFKPHVGLRMNEANLGAMLDLTSPIFDDAAAISTYVDVYREINWSKMKSTDRFPITADFGVNADVSVHDFVTLFVGYRYPITMSKPIAYGASNFNVNYQPNLSVGLKFEMVLHQIDESDPYIIQEPISIPVEDIVVEENDEVIESEVVFDDVENIADVDVEIEAEEEPMGWFDWIIEFFAKLFRF